MEHSVQCYRGHHNDILIGTLFTVKAKSRVDQTQPPYDNDFVRFTKNHQNATLCISPQPVDTTLVQ